MPAARVLAATTSGRCPALAASQATFPPCEQTRDQQRSGRGRRSKRCALWASLHKSAQVNAGTAVLLAVSSVRAAPVPARRLVRPQKVEVPLQTLQPAGNTSADTQLCARVAETKEVPHRRRGYGSETEEREARASYSTLATSASFRASIIRTRCASYSGAAYAWAAQRRARRHAARPQHAGSPTSASATSPSTKCCRDPGRAGGDIIYGAIGGRACGLARHGFGETLADAAVSPLLDEDAREDALLGCAAAAGARKPGHSIVVPKPADNTEIYLPARAHRHLACGFRHPGQRTFFEHLGARVHLRVALPPLLAKLL